MPVVTDSRQETLPLRRPEKVADTDAPVLPVVRDRWSPRSFSDRKVPDSVVRSLLEAARWAPSSYNEQPWRFILASQDEPEQYARIFDCLVPQNQSWAGGAPILMLTLAKRDFESRDGANRHAMHDLGLAMGNLLAQATALDVAVHQMAGIRPERARRAFDIPGDVEVVAGVAIGYPGAPEELDEPASEAEVRERHRKPLTELVFGRAWGQPHEIVSSGS